MLGILSSFNIKYMMMAGVIVFISFLVYSNQSLQSDNNELIQSVADIRVLLKSSNSQTMIEKGNTDTAYKLYTKEKEKYDEYVKTSHRLRLSQRVRNESLQRSMDNLVDPYTQSELISRLCFSISTINGYSRESSQYSDCRRMQVTTKTDIGTGEWFVLNKSQLATLINNYELLSDYFRELNK